MRVAVAMLTVLVGQSAVAFSLDDVAKRARQLAQSAHQAPTDRRPAPLRELKYDDYRDIRFNPERAWWRGDKLPFELMFFHPGAHYKDSVRINEVNARGVTPIPFDPAQYHYGKNALDPQALNGLGHAGFRVHFPVNRPNYKDEVLVFLGASYFRAVGKDQVYGLSARALAVDVATPQGEEFPRFTEFWVQRPTARSTTLVIYALLDSRRVTGAYRFELVPGAETVVNVQTVVYTREAVAKIGLAPLTSMYDFGENQPGRDDYRPEVHDSDGLAIHTGEGEWIWRPLVNPQRLLVTSFGTSDPRGFGLMQRDRSHASYEDPEALYDRRPSAWIEPIGKWGAGRVELVQIPTPDETNDNIVAYWVADKPVTPQQPLTYAYRIHWQMQPEIRPPLALVAQTRRGRGFARPPDGHIKFVVDFDGQALRLLPPEEELEAAITVGPSAELVERNVFKNRATGRWRMTVRLRRTDPTKSLELRAVLKQRQKVLSETWSYVLAPQPEKP
jgi:glucans biosynthesis protein